VTTMSKSLCLSALVLLGFSLASPLSAGILVGAPGDAGVGDCIPFGCSDASVFQQVYSSSIFSGPTTVAGLTFFLNNFDNTDPLTGNPILPDTIYPANYTITLSVVQVPVDGLDTFVDNNLDPATSALFFQGFLNSTVSGQFTIQTTPGNYFRYDPSLGNLLLDIRNDGSDPSITMYADINSASGGLFSSAYDSDPHPAGCPDGSLGLTTGCATAEYGLVTEFNTPSDFGAAVPEPVSAFLTFAGLIALGLGARRSCASPK